MTCIMRMMTRILIVFPVVHHSSESVLLTLCRLEAPCSRKHANGSAVCNEADMVCVLEGHP